MDRSEDKFCRSCGRRIEWRRKWADDWADVKYCSAACRRRKLRPVDQELERAILDLLDARARGATICPSEAARAVAASPAAAQPAQCSPREPDAWRDLMEPARAAARRLVAAERVVVTQKGRVVDPSTAKGPIRIRLRDQP